MIDLKRKKDLVEISGQSVLKKDDKKDTLDGLGVYFV